MREPWLDHADLEVIARSGALEGRARVLDLGDHERALVWIDGRLSAVLGPGLHAAWTVFHEVRAEVIDTRGVRRSTGTTHTSRFESNPTLMRLRELEVLEKVAHRANLTVVLGEGGLAERVVKLL